MATKRIVKDDDFGKIIIRTRSTARNITLRTKPDGLYITVPPYCNTSRIMAVVEQSRKQLLEHWEKQEPQVFGPDYQLNAPCFRLHLEPSELTYFCVKIDDGEVRLLYPKDTDFSSKTAHQLIKGGIIRALKMVASEFLPPLLDVWAERFDLTYKRVKISGSRGRWGSCSSAKSINLSCYLMLLPPHLMDYVILHELTHTLEMNHGPAFREKLNSFTGNQALALRKELSNFRIEF